MYNRNIQTEEIDNYINRKDEALTQRQLVEGLAITTYSDDLVDALKRVAIAPTLALPGPTTTALPVVIPTPFMDVQHHTLDQVFQTVHVAMDNLVELDNDDSINDDIDVAATHHPLHCPPSVEERKAMALNMLHEEQPPWTGSQIRLLTEVVEIMSHMKLNNDYLFTDTPPPIILTTGRPGTGKTTVIKSIANSLGRDEIMGIKNIISTCFMGVAAVAIKGSTFNSLFAVGEMPKDSAADIKPLSPQKVSELRERLGLHNNNRCLFLIIDEISMITPTMLAIIDSRLRQATWVDQPFGGVPLLLFGDFSQIAPVQGILLTDAVMQVTQRDMNLQRLQINRQAPPDSQLPIIPTQRRAPSKTPQCKGRFDPNTLLRRGVELFARAKWFPLMEQTRSLDPLHTLFIEHMGVGKRVTMGQLKNYKPLTPDNLTEEDWRFAKILVSTNRERFDITQVQAQAFAQHHNTVVIRWRKNLHFWSGRPHNTEKAEKALLEDPVFWQFFVPGAPAYIVTNINVKKQIANGTEATCHSLTLRDASKLNVLEEAIRSSSPGTIIDLDIPPLSVNVELSVPFDQWTGGTLVEGRVIIPLLYRPRDNEPIDYQVRGGPRHHYDPSRALVSNYFPFELAFALTLHKAQGRTLLRVILALSSRPVQFSQIGYAGLFVAMSRVRRAEDIRLLLTDPSNYKPLEYITLLKPPDHIQHYFAGFSEVGSSWSAERAYDARLRDRLAPQRRTLVGYAS